MTLKSSCHDKKMKRCSILKPCCVNEHHKVVKAHCKLNMPCGLVHKTKQGTQNQKVAWDMGIGFYKTFLLAARKLYKYIIDHYVIGKYKKINE